MSRCLEAATFPSTSALAILTAKPSDATETLVFFRASAMSRALPSPVDQGFLMIQR